jgi:hypothetical protein
VVGARCDRSPRRARGRLLRGDYGQHD